MIFDDTCLANRRRPQPAAGEVDIMPYGYGYSLQGAELCRSMSSSPSSSSSSAPPALSSSPQHVARALRLSAASDSGDGSALRFATSTSVTTGGAELSPPRCEWEFRLAATVPSTALHGASDAIGSLDFDADGRFLATGGIARKVRVYRAASLMTSGGGGGGPGSDGTPAACICAPAKLSSVRWRPGAAAATVGCGDYDGVVTEYDVERGVAAWERDEHAGRRVWALDYAPGAAMAASGSDDRTAHVWDPRTPPAAAAGWATARAGGAVLSVEFDPSGAPHLAVGSADRRAAVYDVRALGRGAVARMDGHARAVTYVRWTSSRRRVVTSAADGTHRLWEWAAAGDEAAEAREVRSYSGHASARSFVGMAVWRRAGLVASGSESNHVFVYDLRWAKPVWVHPFAGAHSSVPPPAVDAGDGGGFVSAVAWRQAGDDLDGGMLVAGGSDGVLQMFTCKRRVEDVDDDASAAATEAIF